MRLQCYCQYCDSDSYYMIELGISQATVTEINDDSEFLLRV